MPIKRIWKVWLSVLVVLLGGCTAPVAVQQSLVPLLDPPSLNVDAVALAENEGDVKNLLTEGTGAIEFSGLINYYRKQANARLLNWDERLYRVAFSRAIELSTNVVCWHDGAKEDSVRCPRVEQLIERARHESYAFKNLLENVFISVGSTMDVERPVQAWLASPPYKHNIEHQQVKNVGVAVVKSGDAVVYVAVLGDE